MTEFGGNLTISLVGLIENKRFDVGNIDGSTLSVALGSFVNTKLGLLVGYSVGLNDKDALRLFVDTKLGLLV